jgi:hypothetical protein
VVTEPLKAVGSEEKSKVVVMLVEPDQLSELVVPANCARPGIDNVRIRFAAGCASLAFYPFCDAKRAHQRAVIGRTDKSAR